MLKASQSFILFSKLTLVALVFTTLFRVIFLIFNWSYFTEVDFILFINGLRFDAIALAFALSPAYLCLLYPFKDVPIKLVRFIKAYALIILAIFASVNFIDVIYYRFTLKRTTWDIFNYVSAGDDFIKLIPEFIVDFWYMIFLFVFFIYLINRSLGWINVKESSDRTLKTRWFSSILMISILVLGFRGGAQLKPLNIIDASRYSSSQNSVLLLNTPFTLMKTIGKEQLSPYKFMDEKQAIAYFNPEFKIKSDSASKRNVVVIIMESLSKEYVGYFNPKSTYTPFLDSLMNHSIVFTNAYANGKRSIEALPAIFSALPNLMNDAFNTSPYAGNKLNSLASLLKVEGYNSSFFHGGANGTMGFDSYTKKAGFDAYYGMNEYGTNDDFDGLWGIFDEAFFQFVARKQGELKEPFLSSFFSLSAHHPYTLPEKYHSKCMEGEIEILPLICYSDIALKKYFATIEKSSWYKNTIFLITADHTAQHIQNEYGSSVGIYSIPIILFDPMVAENITIPKTTQQVDISPTILDYLNIPTKAVFFGQSALDRASNGFAINYLGGCYQYIDDRYCLSFNGTVVTSVYKYQEDRMLSKNLLSDENISKAENKLKAIVQLYNRRMIDNKLTIND